MNNSLGRILHKLDIANPADNPPKRPATVKGWPRHLFRDLPLYWLKRLYRSRHVRQFIAILLLCSWLVSIGLTCFIAHDNARLCKSEREYIELRQWLERTNKQSHPLRTDGSGR